ncbi:MAG: hypothetical protein EOO60_12955, partial [Hymenobacter sp.]
ENSLLIDKSANIFKDNMIVFAGWNGRTTLNDIYVLDLVHCVWEKIVTTKKYNLPRYRC